MRECLLHTDTLVLLPPPPFPFPFIIFHSSHTHTQPLHMKTHGTDTQPPRFQLFFFLEGMAITFYAKQFAVSLSFSLSLCVRRGGSSFFLTYLFSLFFSLLSLMVFTVCMVCVCVLLSAKCTTATRCCALLLRLSEGVGLSCEERRKGGWYVGRLFIITLL